MTGVFSYILGVLVVLLGVAISIGLHELGHLLPAKLFGVRVTKYMIGFGPTLWSRKRGETEYGIKAIPLGGYISISGMMPPEEALVAKRAGAGNWFTRWVSDARKAQRANDGEYDDARAFYRISVPKKITVMLGGPVMNLLLGVIFTLIALCGLGTVQNSTQVAQVFACVPNPYTTVNCQPGDQVSPAQVAGLKANDKIVEFNGQAVTNWLQTKKLLNATDGSPVRLTVLRSGERVALTVTPVMREVALMDDQTGAPLKDAAGNVVQGMRPVLGISLKTEVAPMSVSGAFQTMGQELAQTAGMIISLPQQTAQLATNLFTGAPRDANGPVSIVGVGDIAGNLASNGSFSLVNKAFTFLMMLGSLNFALFVFNVVPLLPLDGGHVLNALYEGTKRGIFKLLGKADPGPVDTGKMVPFTTAMWGILMILSLLFITADLVSPVRIG
jgi:membrane-associated protease RseP (regulator of RpoE activity)